MEILQTIWTAMSTPNEWLFNILSIPLAFIETAVGMLLFTTILNIESTKKQKITYILILSFLTLLSSFIIPKPFGTYINMILWPIIIKLIFKASILKSILAELIPIFLTAIFETFFLRLYLIIFNQPYEDVISIPIYRLSLVLLIYATLFGLYKLLKHFKFSIVLLDNINKKNKRVLIINSIFALISIATQFYLGAFYNDNLPLFIVILSNISLISYFFVSFYSLTRATKLEIANRNLEEAQLYNKSLKILHDNIRAFKHDFSNIVQAIGGYVETKDLDGLESYYSQLLEDCLQVNNLATLSPDIINNPAIYSILASKYHKADELGIKINLGIFMDLNSLNMKIYEFTRILGILLDNAIEASSMCEEKVINVTISKEPHRNRQLALIQNTYSNKDVDTEKIFEKGYTSKTEDKKSHGLGLWEVRQILKKNDNLNLFTSKDDKFFSQQLEIYKPTKKD